MFTLLSASLRKHLVPIKYLLGSVLVYTFILLAIYILVDLIGVDEVPAYVAVYLTAYIFEYTITLVIVFNERHRWGKVLKYIVYLAAFLGLSTMLFKLLISLGIHYLIAIMAIAILLMPVRYIVNKYWVYR